MDYKVCCGWWYLSLVVYFSFGASSKFDLAPTEIRDALALRYLCTPPGLPSRCDGCGESFSLQHGLDCPKGGLIIRRHNEIRDCPCDIAGMVWPKEPIVKEGDPAMNDPGLHLDLVCGSPRWRHCSIFEWLTLMPHCPIL